MLMLAPRLFMPSLLFLKLPVPKEQDQMLLPSNETCHAFYHNDSCGFTGLTRLSSLTHRDIFSFLTALPAPNTVGVPSACQVNENIILASWGRQENT